ncbi:hypothetical protein AYJ54_32905 [Bradyrhizobium centrolobii]|uniref:VOC domain-containing protein n=1 Tax=Bradyrhizobium centrolobii TaxID=1505087 RepID=A0A176Y8F5_9BRAD|nr:hypothetical protein [Bradyrhizobium centrolobii]OAE99717.1 hypothetical protein AYJ54_32905 [Bradyrhizobium centrolobii]
MLKASKDFDRTEEDIGNVVEFGHVNVCVPDQRLATSFYVTGLGLTRDPYLVTGVDNMRINVGKEQFHLPIGAPQVLQGTIGIVVPYFETQLARLHRVRPLLEGTRFSVREGQGVIEVTCPWGNRIQCVPPDPVRFGNVSLGMPYVEFEVPEGGAPSVARFYREMLGAIAGHGQDDRASFAWVNAGSRTKLLFRENADYAHPSYDGHHIQLSLNDFSHPHRRLLERGLISEESNQHQYRFVDIVDLDTNAPIIRVEHEIRSMRHPMYGRALINRDPTVSNADYSSGHESLSDTMRTHASRG